MSASINTKKNNIAAEYLKKTAGYITGATGEYFNEVMPITGSTIGGAKETLQELQSSFSASANAITPKIRDLKRQVSFRNISSWFLQKESDFDDFGAIDSNLDFDVETDPSGAVEAQISEWGQNANQISKTVVESSHKMVEAQISATANLISTVDRQTAVISSGFDKTNATLNKLLEVVTKNTATLIETSVANSKKEDHTANLLKGGFDFKDYKKLVAGNMKNSEFGMIFQMLPMIMQMGSMTTPQDLIKMGIGAGIDKFAPKFKDNAQSLDKAVGDVIMGALIRLGNQADKGGFAGEMGRLFGIDTQRKSVKTERSSLELKAVPYDTISKEALTQAIPGYLREMVKLMGGPDMVYDYRSRKFQTKKQIEKKFHDSTVGDYTGSLGRASQGIKEAFGDDDLANMVYDLLMQDLGGHDAKFNNKTKRWEGGVSGSDAENRINSFGKNKKADEDYILNVVLQGIGLDPQEKKRARQIAGNLGHATSGTGAQNMMIQRSRMNLDYNQLTKKELQQMEDYGIDPSSIRTGFDQNRKTVADKYGKTIGTNASIGNIDTRSHTSGTGYTNAALFEIYRVLNRGINVYQTGEAVGAGRRKGPYSKKELLKRPQGYKEPTMKVETTGGASLAGEGTGPIPYSHDGKDNPLRNNIGEDGQQENLTKGARLGRWGKDRGGKLARALFSGDSNEVREAFGQIVHDVTDVAGEGLKKGLVKVNDSFGNVSGWMKHKLFGTGYEYKDADGKPVKIKDNKEGGVFGFVQNQISGFFKGGKEKTSKWFKDVAGYFNYSNTPVGEKSDGTVESKRKKLLFSSVGAYAGMGFLGGPFGLLAGAIAGSALSASGAGAKINEFLFGKDYTDKKGKKKHKLGVVERVVNGILDPIKYQVSKSLSSLSKVLKKNILGPLSDIGLAIKDRIANAAETQFGKVFKFLGNIIAAPFKAVTKIAKAPITLIGNLFRGVAGATGATAGAGMSIMASLIAGKTRKDKETGEIIGGRGMISERRKKRNEEIDTEYGDKFDDYKTWKRKADDKRVNFWGGMKKATEEEREDAQLKAAEVTAEGVGTIAEKVTQIAAAMTGGVSRKKKKDDPSDSATISGDVLGAITNIGAASGDVTGAEEREQSAAIEEMKKPKPEKGKLLSRLSNIISLNKSKDKKDGEGEGKKGLLSTIFDKVGGWFGSLKDSIGGLLGGLGPLVGIAASVAGISDLKSLWDNVLKDGGTMDLKQWFAEESTIGKAVRGLLDVSEFIGNVGGTVVDGISTGIEKVSSMVPFMPTISPPRVGGLKGPLKGLGVAMMGGLYMKGASAIGSIASAVASLTSAGSNLLNNIPGGGKLGTLAKVASVGLAAYSYAKGPEVHQNTDAAGNAIIDEDTTRGMRMPGTRTVLHAGINAAADAIGNAGGGAVARETARLTAKVANSGISVSASTISKQAAQNVGHLGSTAINAADDVATSKGAMGFVKKAFEGMKNFLMKNKTFAKFAKTIASKFDDLLLKLAKGADGILKKMPAKVASIITKGGTKEAASVATAGIGYAIMAFGGALSGGLSAANIFGVREKDVNGTMRTIASVVVAMLNAVPGLWALELADIVIAPLTVRGFICTLLYNLLGGGEDLAGKQETFAGDLSAYNEKYGAELSVDEYNDLANKGMFAKMFGQGSVRTDSEGRALFDDAGAAIRTNAGVAGWFTGARQEYARNTDGSVMYSADGKAIKAINADGSKVRAQKINENGELMFDENGEPIIEGKRLGDYIGDFGRGVGNFFMGKKEYQTDEFGNVMYDPETGKPIVIDQAKGLFGHIGSAAGWVGKKIGEGFTGVGNFFFGKKPQQMVDDMGNPMTDPETGEPIMTEGSKGLFGNIGSFFGGVGKKIGGAFVGAKNFLFGKPPEQMLDELGNPMLDDEGNPIMIEDKGLVGKIGSFFGGAAKKIGGAFIGFAKDPMLTLFGGKRAQYDDDGNLMYDDEGNPIVIEHEGLVGKVGKFMGGVFSKIGGAVSGKMKQAKEFFMGRAPVYDTDELGNILYDDEGNPIVLEEGKDNLVSRIGKGIGSVFGKIGNFVGGIKSKAKNFLLGAEEQMMDENGELLFDDEGNPIMTRGDNLLQRMGKGLGSFFGKVGNFVGGKVSQAKDFLLGRQEQMLDENGELMFDDDGNPIMTRGDNLLQRMGKGIGGFFGKVGTFLGGPFSKAKNFLLGREEQMLDEEGNLMYDDEGNPIMTRGDNLLQRMGKGVGSFFGKVGNFVGGIASKAKSFLLGSEEQMVDDEGNLMFDDEGNPIMIKGDNLILRMGKGIGGFLGKVGNVIGGAGSKIKGFLFGSEKQAVDEDGELLYDDDGNPIMQTQKGIFGRLGSAFGSALGGIGKGIKEWTDSAYELDENGKPILDAEGNKIPKGGFVNSIKRGLGGLMGAAGNILGGMGEAIKGIGEKAADFFEGGEAKWYNPFSWNWGGGPGTPKIKPRGGMRTTKLSHVGGPVSTTDDDQYYGDDQSYTNTNQSSPSNIPSPFIDNPYRVTSEYGWRNLNGSRDWHSGIDLVKTSGDGSVGAVQSGKVTKVQRNVTGFQNNSYGNYVEYETPSGYTFMNAHLKYGSVPNLSVGDQLMPGDKLGVMGNTGHSYGDHLHFQVTNPNQSADSKGNRTVNPASLLGLGTISNSGRYDSTDYSTLASSSSGSSEFEFTNSPSDGPLTQIFNAIKSFGTSLLNKIFGGLFGGDSENKSNINTSGGGSGGSSGSNSFSNNWAENWGTSLNGEFGPITSPVELMQNAGQLTAIQTARGPQQLLDLNSGMSYTISWASSSTYHTDWNPQTPEDVKICWKTLKGVNAGAPSSNPNDWSWNARPGIVKVNGHFIAVGFHLRPHAHIQGGAPGFPFCNPIGEAHEKGPNGWSMGGHMCMYYGYKTGGGMNDDCNPMAVRAKELGDELYKTQTLAAATASQNLQGSENLEKAYNYLVAQGFSPEAAAGVLGNLRAETTTGNPSLINRGDGSDGSDSIGICQWNSSRATNLKKFASERGKPWDDLGTQLDFMTKELSGYDSSFRSTSAMRNASGKGVYSGVEGIDGFKKMKNADQAARIFDAAFVRSGGDANNRAGWANGYLQTYGKTSLASNNTTTGNSTADYYRSMYDPSYSGGTGGGPGTSTANQPRNIGGPTSKRSAVRPANIPQSIVSRYQPKVSSSFNVDVTPRPASATSVTAPLDDLYYGESRAQATSLAGGNVEALLAAVLAELQAINGNTGRSTDFLDEISQKEFGVDTELRSQLDKLGKATKKSGPNTPYSHGNTRTVLSMVKP